MSSISSRPTLPSTCWSRWKKRCERKCGTKRSGTASSASGRWRRLRNGIKACRNRLRNFARKSHVIVVGCFPERFSHARTSPPRIPFRLPFNAPGSSCSGPFSWGTYLKLGLVAIITEGSAYNFLLLRGGGGEHSRGPVLPAPMDIPPVRIAAMVAALLLAALVSMWLLLPAHPAAVRILSLPRLQHQRDPAGLANLSRAGGALFLVERHRGTLLSAGGWGALDSVRRRDLAAVPRDPTDRPSRYRLVALHRIAPDSAHSVCWCWL